jgi:hypothetical protein
MKPFPPPYSNFRRSLPVARTTPRPAPASTMRSTVLQTLLLSPGDTQRRDSGSDRRTR